MRGSTALLGVMLALGCQEPELPPPPIGNTHGSATPPLGGVGDTLGSDTLGSGTLGSGTLGSDTLGSGTLDGSGSTTAGSAVLVSGRLLDGPAQVIPFVCYVRLHLFDSLDPDSGLPIESVREEPVPVRALPQAYEVVSLPGDLVGPGDTVYVSALCDVDGDGSPDGLGAYYPAIPLLPVDLPGSGIDMQLDIVL